MKLLNVCVNVKKRDGSAYLEPKVDERGRLVLETGSAKLSHQLTEADIPVMEPVQIGKIITHALDINDDKATPEERRKRFMLACKIDQARQDKEPFKMELEDERRILAAADLITANNLFLSRIYEAVEMAEPEKTKLKAVKEG